MKFELLYRIWYVRVKAFRQKNIYSHIMPLIFNYGPLSGWVRSTGGTSRFLRDGGPLFPQFCHKSLHSWVERGAGLGRQDWTDGEVQRIKVRAPCRLDFLAYEWEDFPLNPELGDLGSVRRRRVKNKGHYMWINIFLSESLYSNIPNSI